MAVTVEDILGVPGMPLKLLAGARHTGRPIRWVHASELEDPTPWLKGGELILTTGMGVGTTPAKQRAYVKRLAEAGVAGLGFGLGFGHEKTPRSLATAAEAADLPLFEVPYPVPFIAITEAVFTRILAEQYDTLQRAVEAEHTLTRAVMEGQGVEGIAASLADVTKGWVLLLDLHGLPLASTSRGAAQRVARIWEELRDSRPDGTSFSLTLVDEGLNIWVQPVGAHGRVEAFLAVGKPEQPSAFDRILAGHALSLFAIELAKSRAVADAERRLQGDFFDQLARGELGPADIARGLARFGFERDAPMLVVTLEGGEPDALAHVLTDERSRAGGGFLISAHAEGVHLLLAAEPPPDLATLVKSVDARIGQEVRAGAGSVVDAAEVGRSLREARYALQVCRLEGWQQAGFADLARTACSCRWPIRTRSAPSRIRCSHPSTRTTATTTASCCSRSRRSCSTTRGGRRLPRSSTCTGTRSATGCARSRNSPDATSPAVSTGWSSGSPCAPGICSPPTPAHDVGA